MTPEDVVTRVHEEMRVVVDSRVLAHVSSLLVMPSRAIILGWPYGRPGEQFPALLVLDHPASGTGIVFCEYGFGPQNPWGMILANRGPLFDTGPDDGWFPRFLDVYFESKVPTELDIWRVRKGNPWQGQETEWLTDDLSWDEAWRRTEALRQSDPDTWYDCWHAAVTQ